MRMIDGKPEYKNGLVSLINNLQFYLFLFTVNYFEAEWKRLYHCCVNWPLTFDVSFAEFIINNVID